MYQNRRGGNEQTAEQETRGCKGPTGGSPWGGEAAEGSGQGTGPTDTHGCAGGRSAGEADRAGQRAAGRHSCLANILLNE